MKLDSIDLKILELLQNDSTITINHISEKVGLSTTPCWRRIQAMEDNGTITKRVVIADPTQLNVNITVFVTIKTNQHNPEWLTKFARMVSRIPEIVEFYRMSGDVDYLLRVVVPDIAAYDKIYKQLIESIDIFDVSSSFAMEQIKYTTALPTHYAK
ncbi:MAG: Lrp/AsnC family transcriptional regulator [Rhizobiales bacterium]|nr:Lrp/AsnC family transcriptional regulator [Hyphomicrobiales bacterium]